MSKFMTKVFKPKESVDINKEILKLRKNDKLIYESEIGLMMALNDANKNNESIFIINSILSPRTMAANFKKL